MHQVTTRYEGVASLHAESHGRRSTFLPNITSGTLCILFSRPTAQYVVVGRDLSNLVQYSAVVLFLGGTLYIHSEPQLARLSSATGMMTGFFALLHTPPACTVDLHCKRF